jgi:UDPglucose 6-dehydrogenase
MKISIIGTGYVGLVTGAIFSNKNLDVTCIDLNQQKIGLLSEAKIDIYEPGLQEQIFMGLQKKLLHFTDNYNSIKDADAVLICVGTPQFENGDADLSYLYTAIDKLAATINDHAVIVIKSTVPPQTCLKLSQYLRNLGLNNQVVMNPEFLREGSAVNDFLNPDRIVIGCSSEAAKDLMLNIYQTWETEKVITDVTTAEMIKYASNTFLATKITFINEMSDICEKVGADIETLSYGVGLDKRIGKEFLKAGPGFGGSCFPKDINALLHLAKTKNVDSKILAAILDSNHSRKILMLNKIKKILGDNLNNKNIGVLGLSFKANTDDVRHSPAIDIVKLMLAENANITAFDPQAMQNAKVILPNIRYVETAEDVAIQADCIVILTEWPQFQNLDFNLIYSRMNKRIVIDLRNMLQAAKLTSIGFFYYSIGK